MVWVGKKDLSISWTIRLVTTVGAPSSGVISATVPSS